MNDKTTATAQILSRVQDGYAGRRTTDHIIGLLHEFIPSYCRRDAWEAVYKATTEQGFELTSAVMRREYEAFKRTQLELSPYLLKGNEHKSSCTPARCRCGSQ